MDADTLARLSRLLRGRPEDVDNLTQQELVLIAFGTGGNAATIARAEELNEDTEAALRDAVRSILSQRVEAEQTRGVQRQHMDHRAQYKASLAQETQALAGKLDEALKDGERLCRDVTLMHHACTCTQLGAHPALLLLVRPLVLPTAKHRTCVAPRLSGRRTRVLSFSRRVCQPSASRQPSRRAAAAACRLLHEGS